MCLEALKHVQEVWQVWQFAIGATREMLENPIKKQNRHVKFVVFK